MNDLADLLLQRRVDALLATWRGDGAGVTVGVVLGGSLAVHLHAGMANIEHSVPIGPETRFRIASVSKQFTCAAILKLAQDGVLRLDEPVGTYLPALTAPTAAVTVAQLMHNSAGLRDMFEIVRHGGGDLGVPVAAEQLLDGIARQRTLNFEPGGRFLYSNSNFLLLGLIVERLTGRSLDAVLQEQIFAPLGMRDTRVTPSTAEAIPRLASGYLHGEDGVWSRAPHAFPLGGEGGLVSSVTDLAIWARNLMTRRVGAGWIAGLTEAAPFTNGQPNRYARGLVVRPHRGVPTWSHGGLWPGFRTEFLVAPSAEIAVIAIANRNDVEPNLLAHRVLDVLLDGRAGVHPVAKPPALETWRPMAGCYVDDATGTTMDIGVTDVVTLTLFGLPAVAASAADGRIVAPRANSVLAVRIVGEDRVEVEQDAGQIAVWRRAPAVATLPDDLPGTYRSEEMAAAWRIERRDEAIEVVAQGPVTTGPAWPVEPVDGDLFRVRTPGTLFRTWFDVRAVRSEGRIVGLVVNGGRTKGVRYDRTAEEV